MINKIFTKELSLTMLRLNAFSVYLKKGIDESSRTYPECKDFIEQHKGKTFEEVLKSLKDDKGTV